MSDPNFSHQFQPSRKGKCKRVIGGEICGKPITADVHIRWIESQPIPLDEDYDDFGYEPHERNALDRD